MATVSCAHASWLTSSSLCINRSHYCAGNINAPNSTLSIQQMVLSQAGAAPDGSGDLALGTLSGIADSSGSSSLTLQAASGLSGGAYSSLEAHVFKMLQDMFPLNELEPAVSKSRGSSNKLPTQQKQKQRSTAGSLTCTLAILFCLQAICSWLLGTAQGAVCRPREGKSPSQLVQPPQGVNTPACNCKTPTLQALAVTSCSQAPATLCCSLQ